MGASKPQLLSTIDPLVSRDLIVPLYQDRIQAREKIAPRFSSALLASGDAFGTGKCADMRSCFNQPKDQKHVGATVGRLASTVESQAHSVARSEPVPIASNPQLSIECAAIMDTLGSFGPVLVPLFVGNPKPLARPVERSGRHAQPGCHVPESGVYLDCVGAGRHDDPTLAQRDHRFPNLSSNLVSR